ncbi:hypothetical protein I203_106999 [Kwoniella mangroviensis CBS 8507]|uniref:hypothetical protein n=1 Tax=Kwoniella mangroviensis CBS 8507 TaxID=1296122 RepID=UPI00080D7C04|nr:uncharacterized protein I203_01747 [Kwoniella mangroviensis CBS 8507]OCF68367.1 hypothetical protein I203_01747 [Kwoniella mangroviensis CBS 8507]
MVLDPFSASSKPFIPPDSLPSRPLPFAATLDDPSSSSTLQKLPRPRLHQEGVPSSFPTPIYSHSRQASSASITTTGQLSNGSDLAGFGDLAVSRTREVGSDEWMTDMVAKCVDAAKGDLTITGLGLTSLSTKIAELRDLVTLPSTSSPKPRLSHGPPRSPLANPRYPVDLSLSPGTNHLSANARSFTRSTSAPASSSSFNNLHHPTSYSRTPSGLGVIVQSPASPTTTEASEEQEGDRFSTPDRQLSRRALLASPSLPTPPPSDPALGSPLPGENRKRSFGRSKTGAVHLTQGKAMDIAIYAGQNSLTSLPSTLFEISNLTVLSLRGNKLTTLPAAIGELRHLKELNISLNHLTELPSNIVNLNLDTFTASSNNFPKRPSLDERFSDLQRNYDHPVARLTTICMNKLISPRPPNDLPPLLDMFEWDYPQKGVPHPLLDPEAMHEIIPSHKVSDLGRVLQALRSASTAYKNRKRSAGGGRSLDSHIDPFPRTHKPFPPDDASMNPYYYPCPSPRHLEIDAGTNDRPSRHLFLHAAEERLEWVQICDTKDLPIRWLGCSPGCLDFLDKEDDEDEEWTIEGD